MSGEQYARPVQPAQPMPVPIPIPIRPERSELKADCTRCFALCCVALPFAASADFAVDKRGGVPCVNLGPDHRCGIHPELRGRGFPGCVAFDCFGAGQKVSQLTFGGRDWRQGSEIARPMFAVFPVMHRLHELLWYLDEALSLAKAEPLHAGLRRALDEVEEATRAGAEELARTDIDALREKVNALLLRASELARADVPGPKRNHRGADLIGARLADADLRGASLRGALLIGADLRRADLRSADVIGADFRGAELDGANLTGCLFLTQAQLNAARGDAATKLSAQFARPAHWR